MRLRMPKLRLKQRGEVDPILPEFITVRPYTNSGSGVPINSAVYATTDWIGKRLVSCPLAIQDLNGKPVRNHYLTPVLAAPDLNMDGPSLLRAMVRDALISGNGYAKLELSPRGPVRIAWRPADRMSVVGHEMPQAYHFQNYQGRQETYMPEEVLHIRMDANPDKPAVGLSPLSNLLDEVLTDNEAAVYMQGLLRRRGASWVVVSPSSAADSRPPTPDQVRQLERKLNTHFQSAEAGSAMVLPAPTSVTFPAAQPLRGMSEVRATPEERITACYHVAASVVGLGTGLEQTKVGATMSEARRLSWQDGVLPLQRMFAAQLASKLLDTGLRFEFDTSLVEELERDKTVEAQRVGALVSQGIITVYTAQETLGYKPDASAKVYYVSGQIIPEGELDVVDLSVPTPVEQETEAVEEVEEADAEDE